MKWMKNILSVCLAVALSGGFTACNLDELADCPILTVVRVVPAVVQGLDIDPDDIETVSLYVFDADECFLGKFDVEVGEQVVLDYPGAGNLHVIAVGNAGANERLSDYENDNAVTHIEHGSISLIPFTRAEVHQTPSDLFYGREQLLNDGQTEETMDVPVNRVVASMVIKTTNLKSYAMADDWDFHYEVESQYSAVAFDGTPTDTGTPIAHKLYNNTLLTGNILQSDTFNLISSEVGHPVTVNIYHGNELLCTVSKDSDGNALTAVNGKLLTVSIDYTNRQIDDGAVKVDISYEGWGGSSNVGKDIH